LLVLSGCFQQERVAGGDDFPNSVETLGKSAAAERNDSTQWNGYEDAPSTPPGVYDSTEIPDQPPQDQAPAAKAAVSAPGLVGRLVPGLEIADAVRNVTRGPDSSPGLPPGLLRAVRVQTIEGAEARDTTWYRVDSVPPLVRVVRISGLVTYVVGRTERFVFEDADGDGFLTRLPGTRGLARARFVVEHALGRIEERDLIIGAGPDGLFATRGDNTLRALDVVHRLGTDTLLRLALRPVEGDSVVFDPARGMNRVVAEHVVTALGAHVSLFYRAAVFADSSRNHPYRFRRVVTTAAGVTETVVLGRDTLPDFAPGDTGRVRIVFTSSAAADTLAGASSEYRVALSDTAGRYAGNRLLQVDREKSYRLGKASSISYRLTPAAPVPAGGYARTGSVEMRLELRSGGWIEFTGEATVSGLSGTYAESGGKTGAVHFDAAGKITKTPAP
jgi:hypothetical protein